MPASEPGFVGRLRAAPRPGDRGAGDAGRPGAWGRRRRVSGIPSSPPIRIAGARAPAWLFRLRLASAASASPSAASHASVSSASLFRTIPPDSREPCVSTPAPSVTQLEPPVAGVDGDPPHELGPAQAVATGARPVTAPGTASSSLTASASTNVPTIGRVGPQRGGDQIDVQRSRAVYVIKGHGLTVQPTPRPRPARAQPPCATCAAAAHGDRRSSRAHSDASRASPS